MNNDVNKGPGAILACAGGCFSACMVGCWADLNLPIGDVAASAASAAATGAGVDK